MLAYVGSVRASGLRCMLAWPPLWKSIFLVGVRELKSFCSFNDLNADREPMSCTCTAPEYLLKPFKMACRNFLS